MVFIFFKLLFLGLGADKSLIFFSVNGEILDCAIGGESQRSLRRRLAGCLVGILESAKGKILFRIRGWLSL